MPQHEAVLACSHEGVLQDHDVVVVTLLQKRRSIVATLGRGDERKGVLRHDSRGRHDIVTRRAVEKLYICVEMGVCWKWRDIPARACPPQEPSQCRASLSHTKAHQQKYDITTKARHRVTRRGKTRHLWPRARFSRWRR
jgi:hypothetical protein